MKEVTVQELKQKIDRSERFTFLDVRDTHEIFISNIEIESTHIPVDDLPGRVAELQKKDEIIVMCRSGNRSEEACKLLTEKGFENVASLRGGINEWAKKIDTSLPVY